MTWVAVGVAGAAVIGGVAAKSAAGEQAQGQEQAANTQMQMFNKLQQQEQPFINAGAQAETNLNNLMNPANAGEISNYISSLPGYQFQLQTGSQALRNQETPGSGALSGQTMKSLMGFNQGLAGTFYNNYVQQLLGQAQIGAGAAGNLGSTGATLGTGVAQAQAAAAGSRAGGTVGAANALGSVVPMSVLLGGSMFGSNPSGLTAGGLQSTNINPGEAPLFTTGPINPSTGNIPNAPSFIGGS